MCDDYLCNICDTHTADCDCPPIDVWAMHGKCPYLDDCLFRHGETLPDPDGYDLGGEIWFCPPDYIQEADAAA